MTSNLNFPVLNRSQNDLDTTKNEAIYFLTLTKSLSRGSWVTGSISKRQPVQTNTVTLIPTHILPHIEAVVTNYTEIKCSSQPINY